MRRFLAVIAIPLLVGATLAGCSSSKSSADPKSSASASSTKAAAASCATTTTNANANVTVTGAYGTAPKVTFPASGASTQLAVKTPDQLDAARDLIEEHLSAPVSHQGHSHTPEWRLVVAPTSGRFRAAENADAGPGTTGLGTVVARGGEHPVMARATSAAEEV